MTQARVQINQPEVIPEPTLAVTARWRVSRTAMARVKPGIIAPGKSGQHTMIEITINKLGSGWQTVASLVDPKLKASHTLETSAATVVISQDRQFTHVEAPGLLSATFCTTSSKPVFARTPVLHRLGLLGGRYELDSATLH